LRLKLVSACTDRWKPISGWSLEKVSRGPKAIRRLVPAGSVYFFEVLSGDAGDLAKNLWLRSVSDEDQDRRDGFGLAVWGLWDFADEETTKSGKKEV
jgi:CRISPR-associated protein Cmr3